MNVSIRKTDREDIPKLWVLRQKLHNESEFLRLSPTERLQNIHDVLFRFDQGFKTGKNFNFVAIIDNEIIGYLEAILDKTGVDIRICSINLGILKNYSGKGIGRQLMNVLETLSIKLGVSTVNLTVMAHNSKAISLYKHLGYQVSQTQKCVLYESKTEVDEYVMTKSLTF